MGELSPVAAVLASQYNSAMDAVSWSTRSLIRAAPGHRLLAADFANIEGRVLALLAGEAWKLQAFRDYDTVIGHDEKGKPKRLGPDLYLVAGGKILGKKPEAVTKPERQNVGKPAELGLGFGGGVGAILTMMRNGAVIPWLHRDGPTPKPVTLDDIAASVKPAVSPSRWADGQSQYGAGAFETALEIIEHRRLERLVSELQGDEEIADDDADEAQRLAAEIAKANRLGLSVEHWTALRCVVDLWRETNPAIRQFWRDLEDAALAAIRNPGQTFQAGAFIRYCMSGDVLYCRLPSGRTLAYPYARIVKPKQEKDNWKGERIQYLRRVIGRKNQWIWKDTYGGSLAENCLAGDSKVLTDRGWIALQHVRETDRVFDGVEFVSHGGLLASGQQTTIELDGVRMTPDHKVLTVEGWRDASSCGGLERAKPEQARKRVYRNPARAHDYSGDFRANRHRHHNAVLSGARRRERFGPVSPAKHAEQVYDLVNCGPRQRFVVLGTNGPFVVHNCVQATARDVLRDALLRLRSAGYRVIFHVHDEIICEMLANKGSLKQLCEIMREVPKWATGLPVAVEGFESARYRK